MSTKVRSCAEDITPSLSDIMYTVKDPGGVPLDRKVQLSVLTLLIHNAYSLSLLYDFFIFSAGNLTMTGQYNIGIGSSALALNTTGNWNNAIGISALPKNTTGIENQAFGGSALFENTTGKDNTAIGDAALGGNIAGNYNSALGYMAGIACTGSYNTFLGVASDLSPGAETSTKSVAIGYGARAGASNVMALGGTGAEAVKVGIGTATPAYYLDIVGDFRCSTGFGCNGTNPQTAYASGGALAGYVTGAFGLDSDAHMASLHELVVKIRAALIADGIMS